MSTKVLALSWIGSALLLQACLTARSLEPVRRDLQSQMSGARFDREFQITLGRITLGLARLICRFIPDREVQQARPALAAVRRVEVAVYDVHADPASATGVRMPHKLRAMTGRGNWQTAVRVQDRDERVWVLYREENGRIRDFYVATLGSDELVLVRVSGDLKRVVEWALREHGDTLFGRPDEPEAPKGSTPEEGALASAR
jgi:hypothetical protein